MFCRANLREARIVDLILQEYCNWSGQPVNKNKSSIHFSPNTLLELDLPSLMLFTATYEKGQQVPGSTVDLGEIQDKTFHNSQGLR